MPATRLPLTLNIQVGKKLSEKTKDEIMTELVRIFKHVRAIQICYDTVRVTFYSPEIFQAAKAQSGVYVFGMWCPILGGGPPVTVVNLFDYPFEGEDIKIEGVLCAFGEVKRIRHQSYVSNTEIFTGTRLVSLVLKAGVTLPRYITIDGYNCRMWYRGQPLICNLCALQGHKSANCPNKDKCRRCGEVGHFARACRNPWGDNTAVGGVDARPVGAPVSTTASMAQETLTSSAASQVLVTPTTSASGSSSSVAESGSPVIEDFSSQDPSPESSESIDSFSESQSILREIDNHVAENERPAAGDDFEITIVNESRSGVVNDNPSLSIANNDVLDNNDGSEQSVDSMDLSGPRKRSLEEAEAEAEAASGEAPRPQVRKVRSFSTSAAAASVEAAKSGPDVVPPRPPPGLKVLQLEVLWAGLFPEGSLHLLQI